MKKILLIVCLFMVTACSNNEVKYDGAPLEIAVVGDVPEVNNENIHFEPLSLERLGEEAAQIADNFDAVLITPTVFEEASHDRFVKVYQRYGIPVIFFNSPKSHYPFTSEGLTYDTAHLDSLQNGSHTTIYISEVTEEEGVKEDWWYFYLESEKEIHSLYEEIFRKVEAL